MNELIAMYIPTAVLIVGLLAFMVSVVIEVIKALPWLNKLPTDLLVIVMSVVFTIIAFLAYMSYMSLVVMWYYAVGAILTGFFVAFVAMFGWEKLTELYNRFK